MAKAARGRTLRRYLRTYHLAPAYRAEQVVRVVAGDGTRLHGHRIEGPTDARCTVVVVHGFAHWSRSPRVHAFAHALARHFDVVVPDLRGHGRSEGRSTLGDTEPDDLQRFIDATTSRDRARVVTIGTSLGAAVALLHAARHESVAGVVAVSPPVRWGGLGTPGAAKIERWSSSPLRRRALAAVLRTRLLGDVPAFPPIDAVGAAIRDPFVIVASDPDDQFFPAEHAEAIYEALATRDKELWWVPHAGHGIDMLTRAFAGRVTAAIVERVEPAAPEARE